MDTYLMWIRSNTKEWNVKVNVICYENSDINLLICIPFQRNLEGNGLKVLSEVVDSILSPENHRVFRSAVINWKIGYKEILEKTDLEKFLWISIDV